MKSEENAKVCNSSWFRYAMTFYYDVYCTIIISDDRYKSEVQIHLLKITHDSMSCIIIAVQGSMYPFQKISCLGRQSKPPISALYLDQSSEKR